MDHIITQLKSLLPVFSAIFGFLIAMFIAMRYKIPDLTRRVGKIERAGADVQDLDRAIDSFHTVCRFNQVSCQKEIEHRQAKLIAALDVKLAKMYERVNALAISNAALEAQVKLLVKNGNGNHNH
jgi:hypothetical protein